MSRLKAGSTAWLLAHELKLLWRAFGIRSKAMLGVAVIFLLFAHAAGWAAMHANAFGTFIARAPGAAVVMSVFVFLLVQASAFGLAVRLLFEREDMALLLSSPISMLRVYAVRAVAVGLTSVGMIALFFLPMANMGPFAGHWEALAAYPALVAVGLACAAVALTATLALVRWLGLRRARVVAQLVGAFLGAGLVIAMQAEAFISGGSRRSLRAGLNSHEAQYWLGAESPLLWPLRAMMGEAVPLVVGVGLALALFVLAVGSTHRAIVAAVQEAPQAAVPRPRGISARRFRSGLVRIVVVKELKLIARDPMLIARALLQMLYLVPLLWVAMRRTQPAELLAAALVVLAAGIAATLAWITMSGEEAPDLLGACPVSIERLRWLKAATALLPVGILVMPFVGWYAHESWRAGAVVTLFLLLALASSALVQVWATRLGGGKDLRTRGGQAVVVRLTDSVSSFGWALGCYMALKASPWLIAGIAIGLLAPGMAWLARERRYFA